jgi:hypothetical protein
MDRRSIFVSSKYRSTGTNENFDIEKTVQEFTYPPQSVKLVSASIPYTWQNITGDNGSFTIEQDDATEDTFDIPPGFYSATALATELQTLINVSATLGQTYTVTYDLVTFKYTFATVGPASFQIIPTTSAAVLGFADGSTNPGSPALSVTSTQMVQTISDYEIFICCNLVTGSDNGIIPWYPDNDPTVSNQAQILARVPISGCYSGIIQYTASPDMPFYGISQSEFSKNIKAGLPATLQLFLAFPSGNTVDLQGYHWSAELVFDFNNRS